MQLAQTEITLKNGLAIELRSPVPSEAELVLEHLRISHAESYRNLNQMPGHWEKFSAEDEAKILGDFQTSPSKFMLAAFHGKKIVGALGFFGAMGDFLKHSGRIGMNIQAAYGGSGLGTAMLRRALQIAADNGFHRAELTVRTYNEAGIALYEKSGFRRVGLLKDVAFIDNAYVDEYLYERILR